MASSAVPRQCAVAYIRGAEVCDAEAKQLPVQQQHFLCLLLHVWVSRVSCTVSRRGEREVYAVVQSVGEEREVYVVVQSVGGERERGVHSCTVGRRGEREVYVVVQSVGGEREVYAVVQSVGGERERCTQLYSR